jgi:hypothetical protein
MGFQKVETLSTQNESWSLSKVIHQQAVSMGRVEVMPAGALQVAIVVRFGAVTASAGVLAPVIACARHVVLTSLCAVQYSTCSQDDDYC